MRWQGGGGWALRPFAHSKSCAVLLSRCAGIESKLQAMPIGKGDSRSDKFPIEGISLTTTFFNSTTGMLAAALVVAVAIHAMLVP
jgi:hypothetical protein